MKNKPMTKEDVENLLDEMGAAKQMAERGDFSHFTTHVHPGHITFRFYKTDYDHDKIVPERDTYSGPPFSIQVGDKNFGPVQEVEPIKLDPSQPITED
jgi:hypothetical protein